MTFLHESYNRKSFVNFLADSFLPEDFQEHCSEIDINYRQNFATNIYKLGECRSLELEVFEVHHTSAKDARVGIAKDAFQLLLHHSYCNRALIAFVPVCGNQWRFSLLQIEAEINDKTNRIKRGYSNPRRFSFLLGEGALTKTPTQFLIQKGRVRQRTEGNKTLSPWEDLQHRFSIEVLTKEFYGKLYNWYLWAIDKRTGVTFPNNPDTEADDRDKLEIKMIRLITRMLFVWFIKQKKLVPDNLFDTTFLSTVLRDFDPDAIDNGNYYNAILQNLFFATLNQEKDQREFVRSSYHGRSESFGVKTLYRDNKKSSWFSFPENEKEKRVKALFDEVPYLNGGLFECLDKFDLDENEKLIPITYYDGFSAKDSRLHGNLQYRAFVPNCLFFAPEHNVVVTVKETTGSKAEETQTVTVMGLIELFKMYNFTVEENTTSDKEVSLDPELLGRVFENLLAAYNPETQESARKSTGSFYTPREIVDYMVEESLIAYLSGKCGHDADAMRHLVKDEETPAVNNSQKVIEDLKNIKILDPACGSGAFPMGVLLKITDIIERLTPLQEFDRYQTKLDIIKNCIYGIDIQAIAMLICKLRFFISLICDCEKDDTKPNFGIIPLPNLETKFVAANSLLPAKVREFEKDWSVDDHLKQLQKELLDLRQGIFDLRKHKDKIKNKIDDRNKCREIEDYIKKTVGTPDSEKIEQYQQTIYKLESELTQYQNDLWVEEKILEPSLFGPSKPKVIRRNVNKEKRDDIQSRIRNANNEINKEKNKSALPGFAQAVEQVTHWDPYDQNSVSPFFDAEWMFGIGVNGATKQGGFDIVIGNPPYISAPTQIASPELNEQRQRIVASKKYKSLYEKWDLYVPFMELGLQLLCLKGVFSMIVPYPLTNQKYGKKLRKMIAEEYRLLEIADLNGTKIFENATVSNCIPLVQNCKPEGELRISQIFEDKTIREVLRKTPDLLIQDVKNYVWNLTEEERTGNRFANMCVLGDFCYISKGMVVNAHENVEKGAFKKKDLISSNFDEVHCRKYLEAKDIDKYQVRRVRYLEWNTERCPDKLSRPTFRELYDRPKLIMNCLGSINVTIDTEQHYLHNHSIYCAILWKDLKGVNNKSISSSIKKFCKLNRADMEAMSGEVDLYYLLGILNSSMADQLLADQRGGDYHIYPEHIRNLPIPVPEKDVQKSIGNIAKEILCRRETNTDYSELEIKLNGLVTALYQ